MSTIAVLTSNESGASSLTDINANFSALNVGKAEINSQAFTGTPSFPTGATAVTQTASDNSTKLATTAYADNQTALRAVSFSTTQVFSGSSPTSYTDLDLSSVVGVTQRLVMLTVIGGASATYNNFKRKGTADTYSWPMPNAASASRSFPWHCNVWPAAATWKMIACAEPRPS